MTQITLADFQRMTSLSDAACMWLLRHGRLRLKVDADQTLWVDVQGGELREMFEAISPKEKSLNPEEEDPFVERLMRLVLGEVESAVQQALVRVLSGAEELEPDRDDA